MPRCALALLVLALAIAAPLAGCGGSPADDASDDRPRIVVSTTVLADLAQEVGGGEADVHALLRPSSDPHDYEPRPDDVVATAEADVVLASGLGLDTWMAQVVEQSGGDPRVVDVGEQVPRVREGGEAHDHDDADPHWWHDPRNAAAAVAAIRDALAQANPQGRAVYARNAAAYLRRLRALDAAVRRCVGAIPPRQRKLVTDHDAFGYFADRYGLTVVGTVIPARTTQAQTSAGDLAELARTIERERVRTIFAARSVNAKVAEAVARDADPPVRIDDSLYGDALGPTGSDGGTYLAMEAHNADAIVRGLGRGGPGCPAALAVAASHG